MLTGTTETTFCFQIAFEQRVAGVVEKKARFGFRCEAARFASRDSRGGCPYVSREATVTGHLDLDAVVVFGEPGFGELQFQF